MPQELTDLQSQATARGWRRLTNGQGWEIPKLLVQPIVGKDGRFRATNAAGFFDFSGSEADCLRVALANPRYR